MCLSETWIKNCSEVFNYSARNQKQLTYDLLKIETLPKQLQDLLRWCKKDGFIVFNAGVTGARAKGGGYHSEVRSSKNNNRHHSHHE